MSYHPAPLRHRLLTLKTVLFVSVLASTASATPTIDGVVDSSYGAPLASDPLGDYVGQGQWDLGKLWITHDATHLFIAFSIGGDLTANPADEKTYLFYIDTTGDTAGATSDAWKRQITAQSPHRPEFSINTWYKGGAYGPANVELRSWTGSAWSTTAATVASAALKVSGGQTIIEWKVARADIGSPGEIFVEVISTGSFVTDNAQDTINAPADDWNAPSGPAQWTTPATVSCSTRYQLVLPTDAGVPDTGIPDTGIPDTGIPDTGIPDTGIPDTGIPDTGIPDTGIPDTGIPDTGIPDTGISDMGIPDMGSGDIAGAKLDSKVEGDTATKDARLPRDSGDSDTSKRPDSGADPFPDQEGCGCAAKGDLTAANSLPLLIAFAVLGLHRRRRQRDHLDL